MIPETSGQAGGLIDYLWSRPRTRGECEHGVRPCPWVSCRYNLYLDPSSDNRVIFHGSEDDFEELDPSCVLDIVDRHGELTLEAVGDLLGLTRERIRQIETKGLRKGLRAAVQSEVDSPRKEDLLPENWSRRSRVWAWARSVAEECSSPGPVKDVTAEYIAELEQKKREKVSRQKSEEVMQFEVPEDFRLWGEDNGVPPPVKQEETVSMKRVSKLQRLSARGKQLLQQAERDSSIGPQEFLNRLREACPGEIEDIGLTHSGVSSHLWRVRNPQMASSGAKKWNGIKRDRRLTKSMGTKKKVVKKKVVKKVETVSHTEPISTAAYPEILKSQPNSETTGFVVRADGSIWTDDAASALELSRLILERNG